LPRGSKGPCITISDWPKSQVVVDNKLDAWV
jgi:hypothetical protein